MSFAVGSLVKAREREWVVLPDSTDDLLVLRPLGGTEDEVTGIYLPLEQVEPARFDLPDPTRVGDFTSCRLLRDAVRLGFRSSAGPFRSFAQLAVEPRPYQLVPLLMALKLDPVRLLIADDVGIGKTVEACLIARELLDRGEARKLAVLCPPHLAEQWQAELQDKFNIHAELVLPSTVTRLERDLSVGQSLFEHYPLPRSSRPTSSSPTAAATTSCAAAPSWSSSTRHTPAHRREGPGPAAISGTSSSRGSPADPDRHLILVTATPHSGKEEAFRSLLALLKPEFADLPDDLTGTGPRAGPPQARRNTSSSAAAATSAITSTPTRRSPIERRSEATYKLSPEYKRLFDRVLAFARETVQDDQGGVRYRQRVRWWSALALLRSMASSPAAAAATLRSRAAVAERRDRPRTPTRSAGARCSTSRRTRQPSGSTSPQAPIRPSRTAQGEDESLHRRLLALAREAEALCGDQDEKLKKAAKLVKELLRTGYRPIVFCRFIPTAEYLATRAAKPAAQGSRGRGRHRAPCPPPSARIACCNWRNPRSGSWSAPTA